MKTNPRYVLLSGSYVQCYYCTVIQTCIDLLESVLEIWVFFSWARLSSTHFCSKRWTVRRWKKPRASSCRRGIISRKQVCQPTERCDVHTERFSMHVSLQAEWRRGHLKQNFKWRHERRRQEAPKSSMGCWCVRCPGVCVCNFMSSYVDAHWMT